jgi:hypothetical protein
VVSLNSETRRLVKQITSAFANLYDTGRRIFDIIEVLVMPEKALEKRGACDAEAIGITTITA